MFCTECGSEIPDGVRFCDKCGAPVQGAGTAEGVEPTVAGPTAETEPAGASVPGAPSDVPPASQPAAPRRRRGLVVAIVVVVALVLAGVGAFVVLGGADDAVTVAYGSDDPVAVTRTARIVPTSSEGTPLEHYVVRIKSVTVTDSEGVSLTDLPNYIEVSGSDGFTMQDFHSDIPEGTYVLEFDDGEETQVAPPIVIDEEEGTSEEVVIEPSADSQDDGQDDEEDEEETETETEEASVMSDEEAEALYRDVLDMFYENIQSGWADIDIYTADISYVFYEYYADPSNIDTIGYQFDDLNDDGTPELIIGIDGYEDSAGIGVAFEIYTIEDGQIAHVATSIERGMYQLCEDGTIYSWGSSGWADTYYDHYELVDGELSPLESVWSAPDSNNEVHWYHSTTGSYDDGVEITEAEAMEVTDSWPQLVDLTLTPFSEYEP